ncbi:serine--tRNA ligase [Kallotenue papyrolyticum]|uniref:serine--tRNA ligase n=1 Tax=Kallotenue papyrolyticum TaxID=1325125 RepID=UPI0004786075|nr:serine--tRNA ligase [Kallotenue papyrolyticum]
MLDIRLFREQPDLVKDGLRKVGADPALVDRVRALDEQRRTLIFEVEQLKAAKNAASREIGKLKDPAERERRIAEIRAQGDRIPELDRQIAALEAELEQVLLEIPNLPDPAVPVGADESENVIVRVEGAERHFDFTPKPHWDLGPELGIIDFERGVKISGSRFYILKGLGARLQRALITFFIDLHTREHGYTEVYPPFVVKQACLYGTGQLPKFGDNLYHDAEEDFWWVPTAEVPVTNMYRDEILDGRALPIYHVAYTPCWRREQMSAGRDVRGIKRGHQFDKVELVKFVHPDTSNDELQRLIGEAEAVCRALGLRYRIVQMCTGDLSFTAAIKYDIEVWAPGVGEWLEVSSCSNFKDFQARRANIRFRPEPGAKPEYVHTLNGSGLALPRVMIAILENYQRADGSVAIPEVLQPYMGGITEIPAPR